MKTLDKKKSIWSSISRYVFAIMFISSWAVLGIALALKSAKLDIGGNISFTATNIYAEVTGMVSGTQQPVTLNTISFDADTTTTPAHSAWSNMKLDFSKSTDIVITINIKNLSTERALIASVTDSISAQNLLVTRKMKTSSSANLAETSTFGTTSIATEETQTMEITLHVIDENKSVNTNFSMVINLNDPTPASAEDIEYTVVDGKAKITSYTGTAETFVIPETLGGYPTTLSEGTSSAAGVSLPATTKTIIIPGTMSEIGYRAFYKNSTLENVIIENGVTNINSQAFYLANVKNVSIPASVKNIDAQAFCSAKLTTISIAEGVENIGIGAFYQCKDLETVVLPNSLTSIPDYTFCYCSSLKNITIPSSVTSIGMFAFTDCKSLESVTIPSNVTSIEVAAFQNCLALKSINIPDAVEYIGNYAFNHCSALSNTTITLPSGIKQIGGASYIKLDTSNPNLNTQDKVDTARRAVMGTHVFYNCATSALSSFALDSSNENYIVVDGVLYTKNASGQPEVLVAYPPKKVQPNNTYTMPDTVTDAYEVSMSRTYNLDKIILSDAFVIKVIDESQGANYGTNGNWANNLNMMTYHFSSATIEVKSTNTKYYSQDGAIYGKDGTDYAKTLFYMPSYASTLGQTFTIKEGTTTIQDGAIPYMEGNSSISKLNGTIYRYVKVYIPASVTTIGTKSITTLNGDYTIEIASGNTAYELSNGDIVAKS